MPGRPRRDTLFAPAARRSREEVARQREALWRDPLFIEVLDRVPALVLVLNRERQILFGNRAFREAFTGDDASGLRPGEAVRCVHAGEGEGGCGTTAACAVCGAVGAILDAAGGGSASREARILARDGADALDLAITASSVEVGGEGYILFAARDVSHEKRRRAIERVFFHDVLNTLGAIQGFGQLIASAGPDPAGRMTGTLLRLCRQMLQEIQTHRELAAAESGELAVRTAPLGTGAALSSLLEAWAHHPAAAEREVALEGVPDEGVLATDATLLHRVLGNMLKNALEAVPPGGRVTLGCRVEGGTARLFVRNPGEMPPEVRLQVFQRSFSTKGPDRGLGTWGMKLIGERYLGGAVGFETGDGRTEFFVTLPLARPDRHAGVETPGAKR